nr:hypothetical protein [Novosphingobium panipatense]
MTAKKMIARLVVRCGIGHKFAQDDGPGKRAQEFPKSSRFGAISRAATLAQQRERR